MKMISEPLLIADSVAPLLAIQILAVVYFMSSRIESINHVEVYEKDGSELNSLRSKKPSIIIREHWNRKEFVVVNMGELSYTVLARDLIAAIENAQNAHSGL